MPVLDDQERLDWLQLIRTDSIGPITFHRLIKNMVRRRRRLRRCLNFPAKPAVKNRCAPPAAMKRQEN